MNLHRGPIEDTALTTVEQPLLYQHCRIEMAQGRIVGEDYFRLVHFQGQESVSDLFEYQLELHGNSDADGSRIDFSDIIGRPITVGIGCALFLDEKMAHIAFLKALDGSGPPGEFSIFHGIVAAFAIDIPGVYRLTMRPKAWRMGLTNRYRIFTHKTLCEVLMQLCREHGVDASFAGLQGNHNLASTRTQDWMQAGETDLEFMRRLMTRAHIYYYFVHSPDGHRMVFDNRPTYPAALPEGEAMYYTGTSTDPLGSHQSNTLSHYSYQQAMGITGVQGVFSMQREAWDVQQPGQPLATWSDYRGDSDNDTGDLPFHQYKIVQYGFSDAQVREYARATGLAMRTANLQLEAGSQCPALRVGHRFRMAADIDGFRPELDGTEFVLTRIQHESTLDGEYNNQFSATPSAGLISTVGIQDTQQGVVLAHVVTPGGSDAVRNWPYYTPEDFDPGRQWLEDSQGTQRRLHAKGVYVRFSCDPPDAPAVWVKLAAHMQTVPEVGCSVWISRANDESELPEIQNIVQADGSRTIVDSGWTAHTQVGNSYSTSYGDSRSLRFGQPWTQAIVDEAVELVETAYAKGIYRDASYSRGGSYGYSTTEQHEKGVLNESWSYGSTYNNMWAKESRSFSAIGRSYHESVTGRSDPSLSSTEADDPDALAAVSASRSVVWGDTYANSASHGDTKTITLYDGDVVSETTHDGKIESTTTVQGTSVSTSTHHGKVSSTTTIEADSDNISTITGTSTNRSTHNIVHNFSTINAQSSSTAIGASNSNDAIGVSNANSATGVSNRNSAVGASIDLTVQGTGNTVSATGMENRVIANGMSNTVNVNGESNTVNVVGASTTVDIAGPGAQISIKSDQAKIDMDGPVMQIPIIILVL